MALRAKLYLDGGCVKRFLPPAAAEYSFETDVFFMILQSKIMKNTSVSNLNLVLRAILYLDGDIFFSILRSKIEKKMSPSKESFAAAGGKTSFTQPQLRIETNGVLFSSHNAGTRTM